MIYNQEFTLNTDMNSVAAMINNMDYRLFVSLDGACTTATGDIRPLLDALGIANDNSQGIWCIDGTDGIIWRSGAASAEQYIRATLHDFKMSRQMTGEGVYSNTVVIDNVEYKKVSNGINIVVYDGVTQLIVDVIGFDMDDGFNLVR